MTNSFSKSFGLGQRIWATVHEILSTEDLIVSCYGELIRVKNESGRELRTGQRVGLRVVGLTPIELQLQSIDLKRMTGTRDSSLDVTV